MAAPLQELEGPPAARTCGRCRQDFAGDATLPQGPDAGWWACDPCREKLLGSGATPSRAWAPRRVS